MPTTSNAMVNDSNLGTKQADVISSGSTSLNLKLVRKSNSTSAIWTYFGFNADKHGNPIDDGRPKCRTCYKEISCKSGNTTNLFKHLQDRHPRMHMELKFYNHVVHWFAIQTYTLELSFTYT